MTTSFWLEKAWGDSVENATMHDIMIAIDETQNMDDEHGAFWVGNLENDYVMEVHKDLTLFFVKSDNEGKVKAKLKSWNVVKDFYQLFVNNQFEQIENKISTL